MTEDDDRISRLEREMRDGFKALEHEKQRNKEFRDGAVFGFLFGLIFCVLVGLAIYGSHHGSL